MRFFYFLEMNGQKIFTVKELIEYIRKDSSLTSTVTFISILYKPSCAVTKKNTLFNKDVIFFTPINIKVFDQKSSYRVDLAKWKEELGDDFGIKFSLRKGMKLDNGEEMNILKIDTKEHTYNDCVYYVYNNKGFNYNGTANDYIKELVEAHKNDRSFKFRPKPKSQFEYLDDMAEEI